jgi:hypothetical protein
MLEPRTITSRLRKGGEEIVDVPYQIENARTSPFIRSQAKLLAFAEMRL